MFSVGRPILTNSISFFPKTHILTALVQDFITSHLDYCKSHIKSLSASLLFHTPNPMQVFFFQSAVC